MQNSSVRIYGQISQCSVFHLMLWRLRLNSATAAIYWLVNRPSQSARRSVKYSPVQCRRVLFQASTAPFPLTWTETAQTTGKRALFRQMQQSTQATQVER